jgi:hypothetical protein
MNPSQNRGMPLAEAMAYVGVKRRTFDTKWRPRLVAQHQGVTLIFDRRDLDKLFDEFKQEAAGAPAAANDPAPLAHNGPRNGRPSEKKGAFTWAKKQRGSTPETTELGKSTSGGASHGFANVASRVLKRQKAG